MFHFKKHYTIEEARALLPQIRRWLESIDHAQLQLRRLDQRLGGLAGEGADVGGSTVNDWVKTLAELRSCLHEFQQREIQIKDLERGLVDFPALREGREVFLCWEKDEEDIGFWHDIDTGYAGREKL